MRLRIKELLKDKGVTTYQLANHLGVTQPAISSAMNGNPNVKWLEAVSSFLGVPITDLFDTPSTGTINCPQCGTEIKLSIEKV